MAERLLKDVTKIVGLCMLWYLFSSAANIASKTVISEFPYPQTVSMAQLLVAVCVMSPALLLSKVEAAPLLPTKSYLLTIVPLALGKVATSVFSHVGILSVPVSYAHTVKALMPLFTVGLSLVIMKEKYSWKVYLSLVPIVLGVLIATVTEIQFDVIGLVASLASTLFNALQNIYSKKVLKEVSIHHLRLLLMQCQAAVVLLAPIWIFTDVWSLASHRTADMPRILLLLALAGLFALGQSVFAFSVLSLMSSTSYSVASATKRIVIILTSLLLLKNPVTMTNVGGMSLAVCGVLLYNKAKLDSRQAPSILPIHQEDNHRSKHLPSPPPDDDSPGSVSRRILQNAARSGDILTFI